MAWAVFSPKGAPRAAQAMRAAELGQVGESLRRCFGANFTILDVTVAEYLCHGDISLAGDVRAQAEVCREVFRRGRPEFIAEEDPIAILAVPIVDDTPAERVALAPFITREANPEAIARAAKALGCESDAACWAKATIQGAEQLLGVAELVVHRMTNQTELAAKRNEIDDLSGHLADSYEELSLLYRLIQHLKISSSLRELGLLAMQWLAETIPAKGFALLLHPKDEPAGQDSGGMGKNDRLFLSYGESPVDGARFARLVESLGLSDGSKPVVLNASRRNRVSAVPDVHEAVIVPLTEGDNVFGWLGAFNHSTGGEFGSSQASLLWSIGTILGIHAGNIELYRQQSEFLASVVRALSSAIDAKDPYTCGHSDRVARVAVRLASEMGCSGTELETIYLSGLLHDIGKIGIDDHVLRKPGKLTEGEYEHIKLHAEIGYRILKGIKQLDDVLPVVRHHHEAWDGTGYPFKLAGDEIPLFARIVAVADAFDAMSSDRPYRKGMSDYNLDVILRSGAGKQWDAQVVEAFFKIRDEIRQLVQIDYDPLAAELVRMG